MKLLELTLKVGHNSSADPKVTINPEHIVYVRPSPFGNVTIIQMPNEKLEVLEDYKDVVKSLEKGKWI
mgnify:FL=1